jgi:hypothetical protein
MLESLLWITHARQAESIATNENDQHLLVWPCSDRSSNNPVRQQKSTCWLTSRPVSYSASPLLSIRKITLFGKWPTSLGNGLLS